MTTSPSDELRQAIALLRAAHADAISSIHTQSRAPEDSSLFLFAAEALEQGAPTASRDIWDLQSILHGLLALPDHGPLVALLKQTLQAIVAQHGCLPLMLTSAFDTYLGPQDIWALSVLLAALSPLLDNPTPAQPSGGQSFDPVTFERTGAALMAIQALGKIGDPRAVPVLTSLLDHANPQVAKLAAQTLGAMRAESSADAVVAASQRHDGPEAIRALGQLGTPAAIARLAELLEAQREPQAVYRGDYAGRTAAMIEALAEAGQAHFADQIAVFLESPEDEVAVAAARALLQFGDTRGQGMLRELLGDWQFGTEAARALAAIGDAEAMAVLQDWYWRSPSRFPPERDVNDRVALLRDFERTGQLGDIGFLEWVAANDNSQTDQGWSVAETARRVIRTIRERAERGGAQG